MTTTVIQAPTLDRAKLDQMRWGTYGTWRGVEVVGFWGIAVMFGYRKRDGSPAWERTVSQHSSVEGFPSPRFKVVHGGRGHYLFDAAVMRRWGQQTGRLHPDGSPARLKPRRGPAKRPRALAEVRA